MNESHSKSFESVGIVVMLGTLAVLASVCIYLLVSAFRIDMATGVRSTAGILLPLVVGGFAAVFGSNLFARVAAPKPSVAFAIALVFGAAVLSMLRHIDALRFAPIAELVISTGLTVLVYAPGSMPGIRRESAASDVWMAYYFGVVTGMLAYVVLVGYPFA